MLRNLLADRFALKTHVETKEINGYALTVAKGGPKFKQAQPDNEPEGSNPHQMGADGFPMPPAHMRGIRIQGMPNERARLVVPKPPWRNWPDNSAASWIRLLKTARA